MLPAAGIEPWQEVGEGCGARRHRALFSTAVGHTATLHSSPRTIKAHDSGFDFRRTDVAP